MLAFLNLIGSLQVTPDPTLSSPERRDEPSKTCLVSAYEYETMFCRVYCRGLRVTGA